MFVVGYKKPIKNFCWSEKEKVIGSQIKRSYLKTLTMGLDVCGGQIRGQTGWYHTLRLLLLKK